MIVSHYKKSINEGTFEDILIYFSKSILGKDNEEGILWDLAKNCIAKLGFVDCVIYLNDNTNNVLIQKVAYGAKKPKDKLLYCPVKIIIGKGITGHVAISGKAEIINDTSKDKRYIIDDKERLSEICVPIADEDIIYGVIDCEHPEKNFFTPQHLKILSAIASICAIKIKNVRSNKILLEKKVNLLRIKEEMLELRIKALSSQLNPHFVFNTLNAIQYFVTTQDKKSVLKYLSIFSKFMRFHLKHYKKETINLKEEIEMLNWYLKLQKLRYNKRLKHTITIENEIETSNVYIHSFVIQTLFENIIEHAAVFNQHKNQKLSINFKIEKTHILLNVKYAHRPQESSKTYIPKYRKNTMRWNDYIKLLNTVKQYRVEKKIIFFNNNNEEGGHVMLKLPRFA